MRVRFREWLHFEAGAVYHVKTAATERVKAF